MKTRICTKCKIEKKEDYKNFYGISSKSSDFRSVCKQCTSNGPKKRNIPNDILNKYIIDNNGCWIYNGAIDKLGYGTFYMQQASYKAHRISYEVFKGNIPKGLVIDHLCRVRKCINPDHLEAITQAENVRRTWLPPHCNTCKCKGDD